MPKVKAAPILLIIGMLAGALLLYPRLPQTIPTHFGLSGKPDAWGSKLTIFIFPLLSAVVYALLLGLPRLDPFHRNYRHFTKVYEYLETVLILMFSFFFLAVLLAVFYRELPINRLMAAGASLSFILLGNKLALVKRNFFLGIRTPWTLVNEQVWTKTHRLGAKLMVAAGVIGLIGVFIPVDATELFLVVPIIIAAVISIIYSYIIWRDLSFQDNQKFQL